MISIAMATYNGEKYLREQICSIIRQSISDWELIICDDCSYDNTISILHEFAENDSRIRIFKNEVNIGFKKNFEKAISLCNGDFIALCDQDDIWTENHLECLYENLADNVLVCSNVTFTDSNGISLHKNLKPDSYYVSNNKEKQFLQLLHNNYVQGCTCLFKRELVKTIIPIPECAQFHDYWIALVASINGTIRYIPESLVLYRRHEQTVTTGYNRSLKAKIKDFLSTDGYAFYSKRIDFLKMLSQIPLDKIYSKYYKDAYHYFDALLHNTQKLWCIKYFIKNYHFMFCTNSKKMFLLYLLKWVFVVPSNTKKGNI